MKKGIFMALAALALALFAVPEAQGKKDGRSFDARGSGGVFVTSSEDDGTPTPLDGRPFTSFSTGISKSQLGSAVWSAQTVFGQFEQDLINCPEELPARGNFIGTSAFTYNDLSALSFAWGPGSFCCTNGLVFDCVQTGTVTGGEGRFEGATGTFEGTVQTEAGRITFETTTNLD